MKVILVIEYKLEDRLEYAAFRQYMACLLLIQGKWSIILWTLYKPGDTGTMDILCLSTNERISGHARSEHVMAPDPIRGFSNSLSFFRLL